MSRIVNLPSYTEEELIFRIEELRDALQALDDGHDCALNQAIIKRLHDLYEALREVIHERHVYAKSTIPPGHYYPGTPDGQPRPETAE